MHQNFQSKKTEYNLIAYSKLTKFLKKYRTQAMSIPVKHAHILPKLFGAFALITSFGNNKLCTVAKRAHHIEDDRYKPMHYYKVG